MILLGLGKTFQVISLIHCLLTNEETKKFFKKVLILTPVNVLENWVKEFERWITPDQPPIKLHKFYDCKNYLEKIKTMKNFQELGGVLIMGIINFGELVMKKDDNEPEEFFLLAKDVFLEPGIYLEYLIFYNYVKIYSCFFPFF